MHREAMDFVRGSSRPNRVCELGSFDVNGSCRELYQGWEYLGVDIRKGKGVDVIADISQPDLRTKYLLGFFDVVLCTEVLEHCKGWQQVIVNAADLLRPGGKFLITAAAPGRTPHNCDGGHEIPEGEHYENIAQNVLEEVLKDHFTKVDVKLARGGKDIYAVAWK